MHSCSLARVQCFVTDVFVRGCESFAIIALQDTPWSLPTLRRASSRHLPDQRTHSSVRRPGRPSAQLRELMRQLPSPDSHHTHEPIDGLSMRCISPRVSLSA